LFPEYFNAPQAAICPETTNVVRPDVFMPQADAERRYGREMLADLTENATRGAGQDGRYNSLGGHSYEIWSWMDKARIYPDGEAVWGPWAGDRNRQRGVSRGDPGFDFSETPRVDEVLKTVRTVTRPDRTLITLDADDSGAENYPDESNNHGAEGINFGFCDGHAAWVKTGHDYVSTVVNSHNYIENMGAYDPLLRTAQERRGGLNFTRYYYDP
jgi:prepilin-type processing-associated H-X9-DG protein